MDFQPRTSAEVRRRLSRAEYPNDIVEAVVADLERAGLLDDAKFSADWVESRSRKKGLGSRRLAAELRQKGIGQEQTAQALEGLDSDQEIANALDLARKRTKPGDAVDPAAKRRLTAYLQRRGYGWDVIEKVFKEIEVQDE